MTQENPETPETPKVEKEIKVLMIDDHPMIIEGYKSILSFNDLGYKIETTAVNTCKEAYDIIENPNEFVFDLVFLDLSLPPYEEKDIFSGEDLGILIKEKYPKQKIIILTSHTEGFLLYNLRKKVKPEGLLVKSDFSAIDLLIAFIEVLKNKRYETQTVIDAVNDIEKAKESTLLDEINREIIMLLSQGVQTKSLPAHFNLSQSTIDKRKAQIKEYFLIKKGGTDEDIIREAKKHGFV